MTKGILAFIVGITLFSCQQRSPYVQEDISRSESYEERVDTFSLVKSIDQFSTKDTTIDVLQYFEKSNLPDLYRLGGIAYERFVLKDRLGKINIVAEGDRETLQQSYYFDKGGQIFYVNISYSIFNPPKWDENSKVESVKRSAHFIVNGKSKRSTGEVLVRPTKIESDIKLVLELRQRL